MAKEVVKKDEANVPANVPAIDFSKIDMKELVEENMAGEALSASVMSKVSTPLGGGTVFNFTHAGKEIETKTLDVVIVYNRLTRALFEAGDSGSNIPLCRSDDMMHGFGEPGGKCLQCPKAAWVKQDGRNIKPPCGVRRFCYMLFEEIDSIFPMVLGVPSMSLSNAKTYFGTLVGMGKSASQVVTRITATPKTSGNNKFSVLNFEFLKDVDNPALFKEYRSTIMQKIIDSISVENYYNSMEDQDPMQAGGLG